MFGILCMTMVLLNYLVEKLPKDSVTVMASGIDTDARVDILAAGEDSLLESESKFVFRVFKVVPNLG